MGKLIMFRMDGETVIEAKSREAGLNQALSENYGQKELKAKAARQQAKAALEAKRVATRLAQAAIGTDAAWQPKGGK